MQIMMRILIALIIVFLTGLVIGILWGIYSDKRQHYMKINKIKIKRSFRKNPPSDKKMSERSSFYRINGRFYVPIVVDKRGYLIDGYTSYLIAKADGIKEVEVKKW